MKKVICFLSFILICCSLCACDPAPYTIDPAALEQVTRIELIQYENPDQEHFFSWVPDQFDQLVPFDPDRATVLETLAPERNAEFLEAFSKSDILHTYYAYNSPKDVCLRLQYENGHFLIVWANYAEKSFSGYIGEYTADGSVLSFWGCFSALSYYLELVEQYFAYPL